MAIITRGVTVEVVEGGVEVPLTRERLAQDVLAAAGGVTALRGRGVPAGGATEMVLAKRSAADFDADWIVQPLLPYAVGCVKHAASTTASRPSGYALVIWIGSVAPVNGVDGDVWIVG